MSESAPRVEFGRGRTVVAVLLTGNLLLSAGLTAVAFRRPPVIVVPGVKDRQIVLPDEVPDAAVRDFGLLYLLFFDNYTPATIEERSNYLLRFVAPEHVESVIRMLSERADFVLRTKESAHLVLPSPERASAFRVIRQPDGGFRFTTLGERRIYIASEPKLTQSVTYVLDLKPSLPTGESPYGFSVIGLTVRPEAAPVRSRGGTHDHP